MFKIDRVTNKAKEFWGDNYSYVIGRNATGLAINMIEMTLKTSDKNDYLNASKYSKQVFTNASRLLQYVFIESLEKQLNDPNSTWGQRNDLKLQIKNTAERIASGVQTAIENAVGFQQKFNRGVEIAEGDLRAGWRLGVNKNKYEPWNVVYTDPNNKDTTYNEGYVIEWANRRG